MSKVLTFLSLSTSTSTSRTFQSHEIPVLGFQNLNIGVCPNCPPAHCSSKKRKTGGGGGGEDHRILPKLLPVHSSEVDSYLDPQSSGRLHQTQKGTSCTPNDCFTEKDGCEQYCEKGYQKAHQCDGGGNNMLHRLVRRGLGQDADRKLLRALCRPELRLIDVQNKRGETPVYVAASEGKGECLAQLIAAGANVNTANEDGRTPVWIAARYGKDGCLAQLIAADANVHAPDNDGETPIYIAAQEGNEDCLAQLIAATYPLLSSPCVLQSGRTPPR